MKNRVFHNPRYLLALFILCGTALLAALLFVSPVQGPVIAYKLGLAVVAAIVGMAFDFLAFPYALPSGYLDRDWRETRMPQAKTASLIFPFATAITAHFARL